MYSDERPDSRCTFVLRVDFGESGRRENEKKCLVLWSTQGLRLTLVRGQNSARPSGHRFAGVNAVMMLMLLMCVIMKIAEELTVDRVAEPVPMIRLPCCDRARLKPRRGRRIDKRTYKTSMMDDLQTPSSDYNSNPASNPQDLVGSEFIQDNMEYQWFIDYRDGGLHVHPSVLSSLSASYTKDDLGYYDDLARNLDANLAEVDMESFRTADIHTLLTALPVMCTDPVQQSEFNYQRERYASISGSVLEKLDISSSISPRASSQGEDSACSTADTNSICKSSLLFSPVKELPVLPPGGSYSVDSLDCEDMLITCQTNNKNNYTIAFEGSIAMYSDGSQDFDNQEKQKVYGVSDTYYDKSLNFKNMLNLSMACSDSKIYTTWSNLKHSSISKTITRHPSGNNNTTPNFLQTNPVTDDNGDRFIIPAKMRSQSLPDLSRAKEIEHIELPLNFSVDSGETSSRSGRLQSSGSLVNRSLNEESSNSVGNALSSHKKLQNMSLVRLFMKQKSMSMEGMSLILDQTDSSTEMAWPTSSNSESDTNNTQIHRPQQPQQNVTVPESDLAIKWVKTDNYENDIPKKSLNCSTSIDDLPNISRCASSSSRDASFSLNKQTEKTSKKTTTGTQVMTEVEDNGVQTSLAYPSLNSSKESGNFPFRETIIDDKQVYVVYPNYTLPDLSFLNTSDTRYDRFALKPQMFIKRIGKTGRPFSCNDVDALKQRGFSHVKDWESLAFLLPKQYRKILHDVPEASKHVQTMAEESRVPLFCLSPSMRVRKRTLSDIVPNTIFSSSSSTATQPSSGYRGSSTILTDSSSNQQNSGNAALGNNPLYLYRYDSVSSEASLFGQEKLSTSRQPSNQHRTSGAPTLPKRSISLPQGTEVPAPPRPPLPRSILRKNRAAVAAAAGKRCSMFEMGQLNEVDVDNKLHGLGQENKRMSLQEPYYMNNDLHLFRQKGVVDSEKDIDEIEERQRFDRLGGLENIDLESSGEEVKQLEEFLKRSGFSSHSSDGDTSSDQDSDMKLRSCVRRFLSLKMNQDMAKMIDIADSQKKTVSFAVNRKQRYPDDKTSAMEEIERLNVSESADINVEARLLDLEDKKQMIWSVDEAVEALLKFWHSEPICSRQDYNDNNECSQLCLGQLCPALYAVMSDGLKSQLNSTFGPISNSVWQVVEASSQQGPLTKTLNDLVQKINGEDFITEGMLKFHAFVFGLLNLRALDAWFAYLCTRESILRKHYKNNSLFIGALSNPESRVIVNTFLNILHPLSRCPFQLDLLYQYRQLHNSFGQSSALNLEMKTQSTTRPRSCVIYDTRQHENGEKRVEEEIKKSWSHTPLSAKFHVFDRLDDSEDYTDSLEHSPLNKASLKRVVPAKQQFKLYESRDSKSRRDVDEGREIKFRKLQEKWEHLGREDSKEFQVVPNPTLHQLPSPIKTTPSGIGKSKIPRPLASPVKTPVNLVAKSVKSPSGIPSLKKSIAATFKGVQAPKKFTEQRNCKDSPRRTSRLDQESIGTPRTHLTRPSSLPYKTQGAGTKEKSTVSPHRRAASTSLPRPHSIAGPPKNLPPKQIPKVVRTLTSKPKSEDGHLSFGEGEKLKVILEVDNKWLLCARGERKGLVPRSCVRSVQT